MNIYQGVLLFYKSMLLYTKSLRPRTTARQQKGEKQMKINRFVFIVISLTILAISAMARTQTSTSKVRMLDESIATRLSAEETTDLWSRLDNHRKETSTGPAIGQANATVQVTSLPYQTAWLVNFQSTINIEQGSIISFRMVFPNGMLVPLSGFQMTGTYQVGAYLWNGSFPGVWPSGLTKFEVIIVTPTGNLSYVSGEVAFGLCCQLSGPVTGAMTVSPDGITIQATGFFSGLTIATINGMEVPIVVSSSPTTGAWLATISNPFAFLQGQMIVTICSNGECSTRIVYIILPASTNQNK